MHVVIMAGGKGTRIAEVANDIPKPMIPICGKPILEYQIECLRKQGFDNVTLVIGYLGNVIKDYFEDGSNFNVKIDYFVEESPLGTAGALYFLKDKLQDDFLLVNGDIIFDVDINRFTHYHKEKGAMATLLTHANNHPYDSGIIIADNNGMITDWLHKEEKRSFYKNRVNAGIHLISPKVLDLFTEAKKLDLDRDILKPLINTGQLFTYDSPEYVKDMGTPERYRMVTKDIESGRVQAKNLNVKQKAIFLDRDGTLNKEKGFIKTPLDLELIYGVAEAVVKINESGYLAILITNQPVIARGDCSFSELELIHNKLETLLGESGAYLDALYFCPHHPDKGFDGERPEYKIPCNCRKPKPGMILEAAKKYNIDLSKSYMVGDSMNDIGAGKAAGCKTVLIGSDLDCLLSEDILIYSDLIDFVDKEILQKEKNYGYYADAF